MNLLVVLNSFSISKRFKLEKTEDKILAIFVLAVAQIIATEVFLAIFGLLNLFNLFALNLLLFLVFSRGLKKDFRIETVKKVIKSLKKVVLFINKDFFLSTLFFLTLFMVSWVFLSGLIFPPHGIDTMSYHLPSAVEWLKTGSLSIPFGTETGFLKSSFYFSGNAELLFLWNILPFNSDFIVDLTQLWFAIMGAIACFSISRKLKIKKEAALLSSFVFILTPIVILQSLVNYSDLIIASLFLISINFILLWNQKREKHIIFLSAISLGILLGVKYTSVFIVCLGLFFMLFFGRKKLIKFTPLILIILILFSSPLYLRNFIYTRDAFYPLGQKKFSMNTIEYYLEKSTEGLSLGLLLFPFRDFLPISKEINYYSIDSGFGPQFVSLIIPSILLSMYFSLKRRDKEKILFFLLFFLFLVLLFISTLRVPRFLMSIIGIGAVAVAFIYQEFKRPVIMKAVVLGSLLFSVVCSLPYLIDNETFLIIRFYFPEFSLISFLIIFSFLWVNKKRIKFLSQQIYHRFSG